LTGDSVEYHAGELPPVRIAELEEAA
jgi:hypothetical protein